MIDDYRMNIDVGDFSDDDTLQSKYMIGAETAKRIFIGSVVESGDDNIFFEHGMSEAYLLTGTCGSGKTFIDYKFRIQAILKGGYTVFNIPLGEKFAEDRKSMISFFNEIYSEIKKRHKNYPDERIFVSFGDIDLILEDESLMYYFAMTVIRLKAVSNYYIFTACCGCGACEVPVILRNAFMVVDMPKPDKEGRKNFFNSDCLRDFFIRDDGVLVIGDELFANMTEGFTYGELAVLSKKIRCWCRGCYRTDTTPPESFEDEDGYICVCMGKYMSEDIFNNFVDDVKKSRFVEKVSDMSQIPVPTQFFPVASYQPEENRKNINISSDSSFILSGDVIIDDEMEAILDGDKPIF